METGYFPVPECGKASLSHFLRQVAVKPWFLPFLEYRQLGVEFQRVVWNRVVIALNRGLSFEL